MNEMKLIGYLFGEPIYMNCELGRALDVWNMTCEYMRHGGAKVRSDFQRHTPDDETQAYLKAGVITQEEANQINAPRS